MYLLYTLVLPPYCRAHKHISSRLPIIACWYATTTESSVHHPLESDPVDKVTSAPSPTFTCKQMTNQSFISENMVFDEAGSYVFVAVFYNNVSKANRTIPFQVVESELVHTVSRLVD